MKTLKKQYKQLIIILIVALTLHSCTREENFESIEFDRAQITSYSELFNVFWDNMNENYNYFSEQKNWDEIYREYSPKFNSLKTFNLASANKDLALKEANLAFKYFAEIISPIIDQHFFVGIKIPIPSIANNYNLTNGFQSRMKYKYSEENGFVSFRNVSNNPSVNNRVVNAIMKDKIISETLYDSHPLLSGFLKSDPNTMYIQLTDFEVYKKEISSLFVEFSPVDKLSIKANDYLEFKKLDPAAEKMFRDLFNSNLEKIQQTVSNILDSEPYDSYKKARENFILTENIDELIGVSEEFKNYVSPLVQKYKIEHKLVFAEFKKYTNDTNKDYSAKILLERMFGEYNNLFENLRVLSKLESKKDDRSFRSNDIATGIYEEVNSANNIYAKIYNPLTSGKAKKIILDLRGNGGGGVIDSRLFVERFITKPAIWGYQRTKEGNGRFNYSPWIETETNPHKFNLKNPVPIIILIDEGSVSMSELTAMMLKSQGEKIKIIGDNSAGGTAALGTNDSFNGGYQGKNDYMEFYMPLMAFKNKEGKIIEGKGVTPDIKIIPTLNQVNNMPVTKEDIVLNTALDEIRKMQ